VVVSAHDRHFTQVFGRPIEGDTVVMPHTRHMEIIARPFLGLSADDEVAVVEILSDHLNLALGTRQ
jgi:phage gpG-like protein